MKVLHVYKDYFPELIGGVPQFIYELSEGLVDKGVESHVLALFEKSEDAPVKLGRHHVHMAKRNFSVASTGLSYDVIAKFRKLADYTDVVHYHFPWPLADLLYFWHGRRKPALITYHSDIVRQKFIMPFYSPMMQRFLGSAQNIVATSNNYFETSPILKRYKEKVSVIPIGIAERTLPTSGILERWRTCVGEAFFLFVGCLRYYKGLPFLFDAARLTGVPIVIVGEGSVRTDDAPSNVTFVGRVTDEDREALLSLCSAFVLSSHLRSEAFGIALLEAARAGKPMISCDIGTGTSYVNVHGETGLVVPPADPQALAEALDIMAANPGQAALMGHNARARYERLFKIEKMCLPYLKLYKQLAGQRFST